MRILVISDIHGNRDALRFLLRKLDPTVAAIWVLGDSSGYGPESEKVILRLLRDKALMLAGNHDRCLAGLEDPGRMTKKSRDAMENIILSDRIKGEIAHWPSRLVKESITLVHGAPSDPVWNYILSKEDAAREFALLSSSHCFFGHTHFPVIYRLAGNSFDEIIPETGKEYSLRNCRTFINPGSVGQPRDGDPRSSFMIFDTKKRTVTFGRSSYPVQRVQRKMKKSELPPWLIDRLSQGL